MATGEVMAESVLNSSTETVTDIAVKVGSIGKWLQAIGVIVVLWIIFQLINWALNRKRISRINKMQTQMDKIEGKIDKILRKVNSQQ